MNDYTWPSVYFAYLFFTISLALAVFFFVRSWKDGYWGTGAEDVKFTVFEEEGPGAGDLGPGIGSALPPAAQFPSRDRKGAELVREGK